MVCHAECSTVTFFCWFQEWNKFVHWLSKAFTSQSMIFWSFQDISFTCLDFNIVLSLRHQPFFYPGGWAAAECNIVWGSNFLKEWLNFQRNSLYSGSHSLAYGIGLFLKERFFFLWEQKRGKFFYKKPHSEKVIWYKINTLNLL